ncbi:MAG TPA: M50 family metallopeptidase [Fimbriimonadaceae bacterium]|nr:M50 family metallopeptidase [Fimbriimonadaceae bacterium]
MFTLATLLNILAFLTMLTVLVAAHELGHYLTARLFKMDVEEFAIGFGKKPLWVWMRRPMDSYRRSLQAQTEGPSVGALGIADVVPGKRELEHTPIPETVFTIRPWPLGGFVRIKGMLPEDDGSEVHVPNGFYSKAPWQRFMVLLAGPLFSVLAGVAILVPVYMTSGMRKPNPEPVIGAIAPDGPAAKAGLKLGDRIVTLNGQPIDHFYQVISIVRENPGKQIPVTYTREGKLMSATVTPVKDKEPTYLVGPDLEPSVETRVQGKWYAQWGFMQAKLSFGEAIRESFLWPAKIVHRLSALVLQPRNFKNEVGGPITMWKATEATVSTSFTDYLQLAGLLSMSLGVFNLLPVPPLDGGQMMVAIAEGFRKGRRLSMRVQNAIAGVGLALVGLLVISVLFVDLQRWVLPRSSESTKSSTK